jgi:lysophospholipase L1-like esterase
MNVPVLCLCLLVLANVPAVRAAEGQTRPTDYPTNDADWPGKGVVRKFKWMVDNRLYFWTQREQAQRSIVLVGDSLTGGWSDMAKAFPTYKVANRGIGGDVSRGVLFRFEEDVLDLHPQAIVILVGTNDLTARGSADDAISNITDMLTMAQKRDAQTPVILCTIPPSAHPQAPVDPNERKALNDKVQALAASRKSVQVCDLFAALSTPEGSVKPEYFRDDKLHLGEAGYRMWTQLLTPMFAKMNLK